MRIVKVLLLDRDPCQIFLPNLISHNIRLEVIAESLWNNDVYKSPPPAKLCEAIKRLTEDRRVDIVVLGNNMGAGHPKARVISDGMKEMTVVVWNGCFEGLEIPYTKLGFQRFGLRVDLPHIISTMLGLPPQTKRGFI